MTPVTSERGTAVAVKIRPAWWSARVWPKFLVICGLWTFVAWTWESDLMPLWPWMLVLTAFLAWRMLLPVVVLHPGGIEVASWSDLDESEYGGSWKLGPRRHPVWTVTGASAISDWRREGLRIRLTLVGDPPRSIAFSIAGISERDRERILAWLVEKVGG